MHSQFSHLLFIYMYVYFSVLVGKLLLPLGRALLGEGGKSKNKSVKMIVLK